MGKIGFVGLGKLGRPVACAIASRGFDVIGYDIDPRNMTRQSFPHREEGLGTSSFPDILRSCASLTFAEHPSLLVGECDLIFVAVQTPHGPEYEGVTPMPEERQDFDYMALRVAVRELDAAAEALGRRPLVVIISTVLPGTTRRELLPLATHLRVAYSPSFIAMGTTMRDFLEPEFVLLGTDNERDRAEVSEFFGELLRRQARWHGGSLGIPPIRTMSIESAELTKVAYNTFISLKIVFANTLMEVCEKTPGADVDDVTDALGKAHRRLMSPKYLTAGMGDGGGCHPRDNIALSWLAQRLGLSCDPFAFVTHARESQTQHLAQLAIDSWVARGCEGPIVLLGETFKPETNLTVGSPARLLQHYIERARSRYENLSVVVMDPELRPDQSWPVAYTWVVSTRHEMYASAACELPFPPGSVILDPHGFMPDVPGSVVWRIGRSSVAD